MKKSAPKSRNPFVIHLVTKKQGAHQKSKKATRTQEKAKMRKEYLDKAA